MRVLAAALVALAILCPSLADAAGGGWTINNFPSTATQATASQAAPATAAAGGNQLRLRCLTVTLAAGATAATPLQAVVRDGATGTGTVIWTGALAAPANGSGVIVKCDQDLRATVGNALTIEFTAAGAAATQEAVSAQGDIVPAGYPMFQP